jgi:hypothetical protein
MGLQTSRDEGAFNCESCCETESIAYVSIRQHTSALLSSQNGGFSNATSRLFFEQQKRHWLPNLEVNVGDHLAYQGRSQGGHFCVSVTDRVFPWDPGEFQALRPLELSTLESSTSYHDVMPRTNASDQALMSWQWRLWSSLDGLEKCYLRLHFLLQQIHLCLGLLEAQFGQLECFTSKLNLPLDSWRFLPLLTKLKHDKSLTLS